ncbi:dihydrofolate reductase family protein [Parasphingopyxis lamellibrachiae]|uniref:Dihydrofolate reductase n=1 Tax=Parasphingopyxis lamellibrachiae TaxID=680125 RepID=A0A3D9FBW6_9SPHN|nr:dihydrofolate reductase family protein [Parasphingopyxis lamellibrachiae]RED15299.1 dihydrofolate reductase [Parasphingopyxis lamellibrachiae]
MRKLAILTFVTLDGVMQAPSSSDEDRSGGFTQGGWAQSHWDEVMAQVAVEAMHDPYELLLGRKTYELFAPHWSTAPQDQEPGAMLNEAVKHVVTSHAHELRWNNSRPLTGDVGEAVSRLKSENGPLIQVHGSWQLIQTLLAHDLIDEFRLWVFPIVLGSGKRLFENSAQLQKLKLVKMSGTPNGVVMQIYRRV